MTASVITEKIKRMEEELKQMQKELEKMRTAKNEFEHTDLDKYLTAVYN